MRYSLTEKLQMDEPQEIEIQNTILTVNADAKTVLKLMDIVATKGEVEGALEACDLLFSKEDRKKIDDLKLSMANYTTLLSTAMQLAVGADPDEESGE